MKKNYGTPELEIFMISTTDVLTGSTDVNDPYDTPINSDWFN